MNARPTAAWTGQAKKLANFPVNVVKSVSFARKMRTASAYSRKNGRPVFWPAGQDLTGHMRRVLTFFSPLKFRVELPTALAFAAGAAIGVAAAACVGGSNTNSTSTA